MAKSIQKTHFQNIQENSTRTLEFYVKISFTYFPFLRLLPLPTNTPTRHGKIVYKCVHVVKKYQMEIL